eukprot:208812_1
MDYYWMCRMKWHYNVLDGVNDSQMFDYKILASILQSLIGFMFNQKNATSEDCELRINKLLFDFLKWIQQQYDFATYPETTLLSYAKLLVELLCAKDKIITDVD